MVERVEGRMGESVVRVEDRVERVEERVEERAGACDGCCSQPDWELLESNC